MFWLVVILLFGADGQIEPLAAAFPSEAVCNERVEKTKAYVIENREKLGVVAAVVGKCTAMNNPVTGKDA